MKWAGVILFVLVGMFVFSGGCSSNNKGKIEGTAWRSLAINDAGEDGEELRAGALAVEFTKGGTVYLRGPEGKFQGKYSLGGGDWVTLHLDRALDGQITLRERVIIKGKLMTMIGRDGYAVTYEEVR